ncbi:MAG: Glycerol-3-phosphate acyltransferase [Syntrophus sp. SKADARSKE-3]|nr:Glycerol-3-phosphate acyltransferase [Syntrophus sp. SKADARSKE-3]
MIADVTSDKVNISFIARFKRWVEQSRRSFIGNLYTGRMPLYSYMRDALSRIDLKDDYAASLGELARKGVIVYALKDASRLNTLILYDLAMRRGIPRPVFAFNINMILWQPLTKAMGTAFSAVRRLLSRRFRMETQSLDEMRRQVMDGQHVVIHLGGSEHFENNNVKASLSCMIDAAAEMERPVYIVPMLIAYGRRRENEKENAFNILFGQADNTGALRRIITFLRYANKIFVIPTEPVDIAEYVRKNSDLSRNELVRQLRSDLIEKIDDERVPMLGPVLKSRQEIISMVLKDSHLTHFMEAMAADGKKSVEALTKESRKYLNEIAADYQEPYISFLYRFLTFLWNNIYDGVVVDREGMVRIRNISRKMPFVVVPCHRSHIDYLLIDYLFYEHHIQLPFIAAGNNMAFGPAGFIFRRCGAFFLRRSFRGNPLYGEVFTQYLKILLKEGLPLEFFIEGGRSRTGKMVMPKYGLLSMVLEAYQEKITDDLAIIPVFIGYDRIIEEKSYLQELGGVPKTQEKTTDIIKSSKVLRKRYGRVYVNIGEPLFLKSYLAAQEHSLDEATTEERQSLYRKIGYEIVMSINRVSVVTPYALISASLLSHDRRGISYDELRAILYDFYEYLLYRRVSLAVTFSNREKAINDALTMFVDGGLISRMGIEEDEDAEIDETVYSLEDSKRLNLEYYKNNILHYFLPLSFVATSMLAYPSDVISLNQIVEDYQFLKRLFRHEFIFDDRLDDTDEVNEALSYLHDRGVISLQSMTDGTWLDIRGLGRSKMQHFAGLIENYLESYWVVIRGCAYLRKAPRSEREWMKKLLKLGTRMFRKGEIRRAEALSQGNYQNAIRCLEQHEVIYTIDAPEKKDRRDAKLYALRDDRKGLDNLRRRIFKYM